MKILNGFSNEKLILKIEIKMKTEIEMKGSN